MRKGVLLLFYVNSERFLWRQFQFFVKGLCILVAMPVVKEPCKQQACDIQSCLTKNAFNPERCLQAILNLQKCCDACDNKSTHCASVKPLLQQITKKAKVS